MALRTAAVSLLTVAASAVFVTSGVVPASASCVAPVPIPDAVTQADVVVVGTVTATRSENRVATIRVEERWKGTVGNTFEVVGGAGTERMATSVDRTYEVGRRYLVFAQEPAAHGAPGTFGGRYEDNNCSSTQPWNENLAQFRPETAAIIGAGQVGAGQVTPPSRSSSLRHSHRSDLVWVPLAIVIAVVVVVGMTYRGRRRSFSIKGG
ncbi:MAG: hypothetical protein NVS3B21_28390 [Acidimicrobiales bacterium]